MERESNRECTLLVIMVIVHLKGRYFNEILMQIEEANIFFDESGLC